MRPRLKQLKQMSQMVFGRSDTTRWLFLTPGQRKQWNKVGDGSASSVVSAPLLWIGRNFPEAPPALWQKTGDSGEEERVIGKGEHGGDHPMLELLERPNEYYAGSVFWMATVMDWHLSGNGYWIKLRDRGGRPRELWWIPSGLMTPIGDERTFIDHYEYRIGTEKVNLPPSEVVHFRYGLDREDPRKGRSPLSALLQEVFTDQEAAEFTAALLGNMGVPGVVVSPAATGITPSPGDVDATKEYLKGGFTGDRRGEPLVMSGPTRVEQFGFNPQQMQLREARRIPEERVSAVLGVPAIVAGLGAGLDRSTFSNFAEAREAAYQDNIIPGQRLVSEDVRFQLLPDFEPDDYWGYRFGFDLSGVRVLQEDRNDLVKRLDVGIRGGWIQVAEGRRAVELEVSDADEIYLRPLAVVEVPAGEAGLSPMSQLSPGQTEEPASPPSSGDEPPADQPPEQTSGRKGKKKGSVKATSQQRALVTAFYRNHMAFSIAFARELEKDFNEMGDACATAYLRMHPTSFTSGTNGHSGNKTPVTAETLARMIVATLLASFDDKLKKRFQNNAKRILDETVSTIGDIMNLDAGVSDVTQRRILDNAGKRLGLVDIEQTTRNVIFQAINEGNQQGLNPRDIARSIREDVPSGRFVNAGPSYRSQLISRTETNWAMNTSAIESYREADEVGACIAFDGGDDPECAERNGQEYSFDEAQTELENEHPNGTLTFAPVVNQAVPA